MRWDWFAFSFFGSQGHPDFLSKLMKGVCYLRWVRGRLKFWFWHHCKSFWDFVQKHQLHLTAWLIFGAQELQEREMAIVAEETRVGVTYRCFAIGFVCRLTKRPCWSYWQLIGSYWDHYILKQILARVLSLACHAILLDWPFLRLTLPPVCSFSNWHVAFTVSVVVEVLVVVLSFSSKESPDCDPWRIATKLHGSNRLQTISWHEYIQ